MNYEEMDLDIKKEKNGYDDRVGTGGICYGFYVDLPSHSDREEYGK